MGKLRAHSSPSLALPPFPRIRGDSKLFYEVICLRYPGRQESWLMMGTMHGFLMTTWKMRNPL